MRAAPAADGRRNLHLFSWIPVAGFQVDAGFLIDPLSLTFVLLITGVGSLIHIYAVGYMAHDAGRRRFFGYFNLFIAAMLLLVLGNGYLPLYVGWEGVGLASYLLIGFYYDRPSAATAAKKAFIANRVGDVGLSIAIMLMFSYFGTTSFSGVFDRVGGASTGVATAIGLMLLLGACGKSGQFPLQTWLPDAMEGPTPVSALIHAATMVTAGVYLIARSAPIFDVSQAARTVVTIIGAITLLYGCVCAFGQDDLKRVLAYSTVSQIGYMFLAVGLGKGVYAIGILHLLGHGFFKAALFLSAGSVMHAMNDRIDMRRFGGLYKVMPITYGVFVCGYLAIIGFPGATGFFTKDKIIEAALDKGGVSGWVLGLIALLGAGLTAAYMTRALIMTFHGERRWEDDVHPHEAPFVMTIPMIVLAVLSIIGGAVLVFGGGLQHWLTPSVGSSVEVGGHTISPIVLTALTLIVVAMGVGGGLPGRRPQAGSADRTSRGVGDHGRRARAALGRRVQRVVPHASGPVADPRPRLPRQPRDRRHGERPRRRARRGFVPVAANPDRVRALVRPVDAGRYRVGAGRAHGGEVRMTRLRCEPTRRSCLPPVPARNVRQRAESGAWA